MRLLTLNFTQQGFGQCIKHSLFAAATLAGLALVPSHAYASAPLDSTHSNALIELQQNLHSVQISLAKLQQQQRQFLLLHATLTEHIAELETQIQNSGQPRLANDEPLTQQRGKDDDTHQHSQHSEHQWVATQHNTPGGGQPKHEMAGTSNYGCH